MTLGERIAYYRKKAGYSQEGLAERLGVMPQAYASGHITANLRDEDFT